MQGNDRAGIQFAQPKSFEERFGIAEQCNIRLDMSTPMLIDDIANSTCENYAAFPDRLYIIDLDGKVAYKGGRGPFGYKPREMEQSLLLLMMEAQIKAASKTSTKPTQKPNIKKPDPAKKQEKKQQPSNPAEKPEKKPKPKQAAQKKPQPTKTTKSNDSKKPKAKK